MADTFPLLNIRGIEGTTPSFREQLVAGSLAYGLNPSYIAAVLAFESGFNPKARNPDGGALGLLQWRKSIFPAVAKKAGMSLAWEDLPNLTAEEQLPLVFAYYADKPIRETSSPSDYYLAVFLPIGVGKPQDFVLGERDSDETHPGGLSLGKVYALNQNLDKNPTNGLITVEKAAAPVLSILAAARGRAPLAVPLDPGHLQALSSTVPSPLRPDGGVYSSPLPRPARLPSSFGDRGPGTGDRVSEFGAEGGPSLHDLPLLKKGDVGSAVCLLQRLLFLLYPEESAQEVADGLFGPFTMQLLEQHQTDYRERLGLHERDFPSDGVCGPATWASFWQPWVWRVVPTTSKEHPAR